MAKAWIVKGKVYSAAVDREMNQKILNPDYEVKNIGDADVAYEAFKKALETAEKKFETKEALNGLTVTAGHISNAAITAFQEKQYDAAFTAFEHSLELDDILVNNGEPSTFPDDAIRGEQLFYTAISGYYAEKYDEVEPYFLKAKELSDPDPFIFEGLYNMNKESDPDVAIGYLNEGREKYPDDTALLYAEINYLVAQGKLEQLIEKLEDAVEKDPENLSVYTTLGSVYDNLATKMAKDSMVEKSAEYFEKSKLWFEKALDKDAQNFDALYSLGALYYNRAATYTEPLNELANDFSAAGNKKYEALKAEMDGIFEKAFPYFKKAEEVRPNDANTLLAIREIYARKGDMEKTNEYKAKLEALNN
jgi:tetratricopeptide (TPR) repeat protein